MSSFNESLDISKVDHLNIHTEREELVIEDLNLQKRIFEEALQLEKKQNLNLETKLTKEKEKMTQIIKNTEIKEIEFDNEISSLRLKLSDNELLFAKLKNEITSKDREIHKLKNESLIIEDHSDQIKFLTDKLALTQSHFQDSETRRQILQEKLSLTDNELENLLRNIKSLKHPKDIENEKLTNEVEVLRAEVTQNKQEIANLETDKLENSANFQQKNKELEQKLILMEESNKELKSIIQKLKSTHKFEISELQQTLDSLLLEKDDLEVSFNESRHKADSRPDTQVTYDEVDKLLDEYHNTHGIDNRFLKIAPGLYIFGSKKLNVLIKNDCIICRVGGGYMMIDEFLKLYLASTEEPETNLSRKRQVSCVPTSKSSVSPIRSAHKRNTSITLTESVSARHTPTKDLETDSIRESKTPDLNSSFDRKDEESGKKTMSERHLTQSRQVVKPSRVYPTKEKNFLPIKKKNQPEEKKKK